MTEPGIFEVTSSLNLEKCHTS